MERSFLYGFSHFEIAGGPESRSGTVKTRIPDGRTLLRDSLRRRDFMNCAVGEDEMLLFAADALDADEREELRRHLSAGCPRCAGSLAKAEATLAHLPGAIDLVAPGPEVWDRLVARIAAEGKAGRGLRTRSG